MAQHVLMKLSNGGCSCCDPPPAPGIAIDGSVGRGGRNLPNDVRTIQAALNNVSSADGGPTLKLAVDGFVGPLTIAAIEKYQTRKLGWADGRIDPDGPTIHALNGQSGGVSAPAQKAAPPPPPPAASQGHSGAEPAQFVERIGLLLPRARHWIHDGAAQYRHGVRIRRARAPPGPQRSFPSPCTTSANRYSVSSTNIS